MVDYPVARLYDHLAPFAGVCRNLPRRFFRLLPKDLRPPILSATGHAGLGCCRWPPRRTSLSVLRLRHGVNDCRLLSSNRCAIGRTWSASKGIQLFGNLGTMETFHRRQLETPNK